MPNKLKKIKDFSDEEKAAILARANKIELPRVAKEFGTTWQVVSAIQRAAKNGVKKSKAVAVKKVKAASSQKAERSSNERRLEILKRASEIGITKAAEEAGVSKWTVFQWRKVMKKAGYEVPPAPRAHRGNAVNNAVKTKVPDVKPVMLAKRSGTYSQLELENEMLKQQVANLSTQVSKLRAALSQLA